MYLVVGTSVSDDGNDHNRQCTMYSSVCFKTSIWHTCLWDILLCMRSSRRIREDPVSYAIWKCRPPGWYRGKCGSSFVPAMSGSCSDDVMCSCFYSGIHCGRLSLAQRYRGDLVSVMISLRFSKALNTGWDKLCVRTQSEENLETINMQKFRNREKNAGKEIISVGLYMISMGYRWDMQQDSLHGSPQYLWTMFIKR